MWVSGTCRKLVVPGACGIWSSWLAQVWAKKLWGPYCTQAVAEGDGLVKHLSEKVRHPDMDHLVCPCCPHPKVLEQLWPPVS